MASIPSAELNLPKVRGKYRINYSLSNMSWFGVGGKADVIFIPEDLEDLQFFLQNKPHFATIAILGVGSNTLVRDGGISGLVIRLGRGFNYINHNETYINAGSAVMSLNLALYCQDNALQGLEFLAGIPGTIGGALAMNAGAYGQDVAGKLFAAKAINCKDGIVKTFMADEIRYKYRGNELSGDWIFIEGIFTYTAGDKESIMQKIRDIQEKRSSTQPIKNKTAGSTFKNPEGLKAWELIDKAGCRGLKIGGAQISEQHCNFIINTGDATAYDIETLIHLVQDRVLKKCGILLEPEIKIIGCN